MKGYTVTQKRKDLHPAVSRYIQVVVRQAISDGTIEKKPCEICEGRIAMAHHDNYSKPLTVRFLCPQCHVDFHRNHKPLPPIEEVLETASPDTPERVPILRRFLTEAKLNGNKTEIDLIETVINDYNKRCRK